MKKFLFLFFILLSSPCFSAQFTFVQAKTQGFAAISTPRTLSFTSNVTAGSLLVCVVGGETNSGSAGAPSVTDNINSSSWTMVLPTFLRTATVRFQNVFYTTNTAGGTMTVTVTPNSGLSMFLNIGLLEYTPSSPTNVLLDSATTVNLGGTTVIHTGTVTISGVGELIIGAYTQGNAVTSTTINSPFTLRNNQPTGTSTEGGGSGDDSNALVNEEAIFTLGATVSNPIGQAVSFMSGSNSGASAPINLTILPGGTSSMQINRGGTSNFFMGKP